MCVHLLETYIYSDKKALQKVGPWFFYEPT